MTLICIGPVTKDLIIVGSEKSFKVEGQLIFKVLFLKNILIISAEIGRASCRERV